MDTGIPLDAITGGMPDIGLARHIPAHAGMLPGTMENASTVGTGKATEAGASTTITGTASVTAIFVSMTETTTVTS